MSYILDSLDDIAAAVPGLNGKIDRNRIAASGHSFGGQIALALTEEKVEVALTVTDRRRSAGID